MRFKLDKQVFIEGMLNHLKAVDIKDRGDFCRPHACPAFNDNSVCTKNSKRGILTIDPGLGNCRPFVMYCAGKGSDYTFSFGKISEENLLNALNIIAKGCPHLDEWRKIINQI